MTDKPPFDPSKPFDVAGDKPAFDPSKPFDAAPQVSAGEDALKSTAAGLGNATIGTLGMGGDFRSLVDKGVDALGNKLGFDGPKVRGVASTIANMTPLVALNNAPTSQQVKDTVSNPLVSPDYQPQTAVGGALKTGAELLPGMVDPELAGPSVARAAGRLFLTRVAAPAVAAETAGAVTKGTAAEPYARASAALLTTAVAPSALRGLTRAGETAAPAVEELKAAARAQYQHPEVQAVRINPQTTSNLADTITQDLQHGQNSGFRAANEPAVFNAVDELRTAATEGRPSTVADLDSVRQVLGNLAKERDATGQMTRQAIAANRAIDHINEFLPNLNQTDLLAGNATNANLLLGRARQNWGAAKRAENVQTLASNAEINAASANSGANIQNATKQAFKPMLKNNAAKAVGYNDQEIAALNQIVRGTWAGSAARAAGNLLGGGGGLGMLAGGAAGYEAGGIPGAITAGIAGRGLKMIGNRSTLNAVYRLDNMLRARSPEAIRVAAQNPQIAQLLPSASMQRLRALISAEPMLAQQIGQTDNSNRRQ